VSEIEYHGWIVLASSHDEWADDDWGRALANVAERVSEFATENGHAVTVTEPTNSMQTLSLHGLTDEPPDRVLQLVEFIVSVLDSSYGEMIIAPAVRFDWSAARRYRLSNGKLTACDS
jgi:hypothetical protein